MSKTLLWILGSGVKIMVEKSTTWDKMEQC